MSEPVERRRKKGEIDLPEMERNPSLN